MSMSNFFLCFVPLILEGTLCFLLGCAYSDWKNRKKYISRDKTLMKIKDIMCKDCCPDKLSREDDRCVLCWVQTILDAIESMREGE